MGDMTTTEKHLYSTILNFSSHEAFEAKQEKKWVGQVFECKATVFQ